MRRSLLSERESFALHEALLVTDREPNCAARFVVDKCTIVGRQVRYRALFAFVSIMFVRTDLVLVTSASAPCCYTARLRGC